MNPEGTAARRPSQAELESEIAVELPRRDLMLGISLLGIPLLTLDGVNVNIDTAGPNWLFGSASV